MSCRFTTGAIRVEGRTHVVLPRIGRVNTHEATTALLNQVTAGGARIMAATVSWDGQRWYCSFTVETSTGKTVPAQVGRSAHPVVGCDAGVRDLLVVAAPDGTVVERVAAPRSLSAAQSRLRRVQRRAARQVGPDQRTWQRTSNRWRHSQTRIARVHARAANIRSDALHQASTRLTHRHQVVVIEDLNVAGMLARKPGAGRGGRGLNRAISDAGWGQLRRQLSYKSACGLRLDRDVQAAINLARLGDTPPGQTGVGERGWPGVAR